MDDLTFGEYNPDWDYPLATAPDNPDMRESTSMWIYDKEGRFGFPRITVEVVGEDWNNRGVEANFAFPDGRTLVGSGGFPPVSAELLDGRLMTLGAGPVRFELKVPLRRWTMSFDGEAYDTTIEALMRDEIGGPTRHVKLEIDATMVVPPWNPGEEAARAGDQTSALAVGGVGGQRIEQLFECVGTFLIHGEEERRFEGTGLRIRRTGLRSLGEFAGHCWMSAVFPSGKAFGALTFPGQGQSLVPGYSEAFIFDGTRKRYGKVIEAPWLTQFVPNGGACDLVLEIEEREIVRINGLTHLAYFAATGRPQHGDWSLDVAMPMPFHQGGARYSWDGESTYGMIERSLPEERWTSPLPKMATLSAEQR